MTEFTAHGVTQADPPRYRDMTARLASSPPEDFLEFLAERHALPPSQARCLLSTWLLNYEPSPEARIRARSLQREPEATAQISLTSAVAA